MKPEQYWMLQSGITIIGWPLSAFFTYRCGLRSQAVAALRESKVAALAVIDQVRQDIHTCLYLPKIIAPAQMRLKDPVFNFSARFAAQRRVRIETAWREYQSVGEDDVHPDNRAFRDGGYTAEKARLLLLEPLEKLRAEIDPA